MNVVTLRRIDRAVGGLACRILTLHRRLAGRGTGSPGAQPRRLLLLKLAEQGATVLAIPAIRSAVDRVGKENVFVLVFEDNRFILDLLDLVPPDNIITLPTGSPIATVRGLVGALRRLRRERIDAAVDFEFFARSTAVLSYLSGARVRVGLHAHGGEGPYRGNLLTHRVRHNPRLHASQSFQILVDAVDLPAEVLPAVDRLPPAPLRDYPRFQVSGGETGTIAQRLGLPAGPLVVMHPNPADVLPLRRWPLERYETLARRLLASDPRLVVAITGLPEEVEVLGAAVERVGSSRCVNAAGRTTLREFLVLLSGAEVLVTSDCGPAHFAALTPVETVVLFGPESPRVFGALGPRHQPLWAGLACSPCLSALNDRHSACADNRCLQRIAVEEVEDAVRTARETVRGRNAGNGTSAASPEPAGPDPA